MNEHKQSGVDAAKTQPIISDWGFSAPDETGFRMNGGGVVVGLGGLDKRVVFAFLAPLDIAPEDGVLVDFGRMVCGVQRDGVVISESVMVEVGWEGVEPYASWLRRMVCSVAAHDWKHRPSRGAWCCRRCGRLSRPAVEK